MKILLSIFIVYLFAPCGSCQSGEDFTKLHQDLYKIHPNVRPVKNISTETKVTLSFHLSSINSFETVNRKLITNGWLRVQWTDVYMVWNPSDYGGVKIFYPETSRIWRPSLTILNTMKDLKTIGADHLVITCAFDGLMTWYPAESFETFCDVEVTYYPFDFQVCRWVITVWSYANSSVGLYPATPQIDLNTFVNNGEWELMSTKGYRVVQNMGTNFLSFVVYEAVLRRRPSLFILTVLVPVFVLAEVNVFIFAIPWESGKAC